VKSEDGRIYPRERRRTGTNIDYYKVASIGTNYVYVNIFRLGLAFQIRECGYQISWRDSVEPSAQARDSVERDHYKSLIGGSLNRYHHHGRFSPENLDKDSDATVRF